MNSKLRRVCAPFLALAVAGCASMTPTHEVKTAYVVYDIRPTAGVTASQLAAAVKTALQRNTSALRIQESIPPSPLPEKAARFQLVSPFGPGMAALAGAAGRVPTCDGAVMSANATDSSMARYAESTTFFVCLIPYRDGYAMDIYTTFSKSSGMLNPALLGATVARSLVGDSSQFIPRTVSAIVDNVKVAGAEVTQVDAYPR